MHKSCEEAKIKTNIQTYKQSNDILTICPLDSCEFSAGALYSKDYWMGLIHSLTNNQQKLIALHSNYLIGNEAKYHSMKKHGFWISRVNTVNFTEYENIGLSNLYCNKYNEIL